MQKTVLNEVFETLRAHKLVNSESEFSKDWCGRAESYLRCMRFNDLQPSVASIAICASKLQHYGHRMIETDAHKALGEQFIELSDLCHNHINAECEASWIDQVRT